MQFDVGSIYEINKFKFHSILPKFLQVIASCFPFPDIIHQ